MTLVNKLFFKQNDVWVPVKRPYIKRSNVYMPAKTVYIKQAGEWVENFVHDTTPCSPPTLSLEIIDNRYIKVGAKLPGSVDDELRRIRVLASKDAMPTTQFGSGFLSARDVDWPDEAWSEWWYNGRNPNGGKQHGDGVNFNYKQYPPNPTSQTNIYGGRYYYFAAWSEDANGNWSAGTYSKIWMPKDKNNAPAVINKEANFQANGAGSAGLNGADYTAGKLLARDSPRSNGFWFHGTKFNSAIGEKGNPTIKSAKIRITRGSETGNPTANVNLFWHKHTTNDDVAGSTGAERYDITKVGTINKGETKWFDIPTSYYSHFNTEIKGFGLAGQPDSANDLMAAVGLATDLRCGEVNVVWEEAL